MSFILISLPSCLNNSSTVSLWPSDAARINAVIIKVWVKFYESFNFSIQLKIDRFEFYECFWFKMSWLLISMPFCCKNSSTTSLWPLYAAQLNAAKLKVWVKFHESFNFLILWKKVRFEFDECFSLKCLSCRYQCLLVVIIVQLFLYVLFLQHKSTLSY